MDIFSVYGQEFAIGIEKEADAAASEYIRESLWTFRPEFVASHTKAGATKGMIAAIKALQEACEDANEDIKSLIVDLDAFVSDAIAADGRGVFLSPMMARSRKSTSTASPSMHIGYSDLFSSMAMDTGNHSQCLFTLNRIKSYHDIREKV